MFKTVKTSDLKGATLDWAVAKCEGHESGCGGVVPYSTDWSQGGPIIEGMRIGLRGPSVVGAMWAAFVDASGISQGPQYRQVGPTPLVAAMRCYVASTIGDTVEIPQELA